MPVLTRRQFLALTGSAGLSLLAAAPLLATARPTYLYCLLDEMVADSLAANLLGTRYLQQHDDRAGIQSFRQGLLQLLTGDETRDRKALANSLQRLYHSDFSRHDSVILEGWLIPRSEARLFALLSGKHPTV